MYAKSGVTMIAWDFHLSYMALIHSEICIVLRFHIKEATKQNS